MGVGGGMALLEHSSAAAAAAAVLSLPSSSLMRSVGWATLPMQGSELGMRRSRSGRQCEQGQKQRRGIMVTRNLDEQGAAAGKDRTVALKESKKLLAMQKELLDQIEERQKLFSSSSTSTGQSSTSEEDVAEASPSGRPHSTAASKRSVRSDRAAASPPLTIRPAGYPEPSAEPEESMREFHSDHSREGTGRVASPVSEPALTDADADADAPKAEEKPPPLAGPNVMNIVVVAAECAPWSKTGGLGDVVGALPKALARRGHRVMVVAPRYSNYAEAWETGVRRIYNVAGQVAPHLLVCIL